MLTFVVVVDVVGIVRTVGGIVGTVGIEPTVATGQYKRLAQILS